MFLFPIFSGAGLVCEGVSRGHPDKVADQIADAILDFFLDKDSSAKVAVEVMVCKGRVVVSGEVSLLYGSVEDDISACVRNVVKDIGYASGGFDWKSLFVEVNLNAQSSDIAIGLSSGAGDQGVMYGFASDEVSEVMIPAPIYYARKIVNSVYDLVVSGELQGLGIDSKTQITVVYDELGVPYGVKDLVFSIQHDESLVIDQVEEIVRPHLVSVFPSPDWMCAEDRFFLNPTGRFVIGGPVADCGVTGRKIMFDTYGCHLPHGGGAFSGKDPTKVDRSAAYIARYIAKNVVAASLANACIVRLAYCIGVSIPISFEIDTFGTGVISDHLIREAVLKLIDLSPDGIISLLSLNRPIYYGTARAGHFGYKHDPKNGFFTWEALDFSDVLRSELHI